MATTTSLLASFGWLYCIQFSVGSGQLVVPATTNSNDTMFATVDPVIYTGMMLYFLPPDYDLPQNAYEWNMTEIVYYVNQTDPSFMYDLDTEALLANFPLVIVKQLPRDVLVHHGLTYLLPQNDTAFCSNCSNITVGNWVECVRPYVQTKHNTYFEMTVDFANFNHSYDCALMCEYGDVLWGMKPEEQHSTDMLLYTCSIILLVMVVVVWVNQCMEAHCGEKLRCCYRGFLYQANVCLLCFSTCFALIFLIPLMIGKNNVVCAQDLNGVQTVSMRNPGGGSEVCAVFGALFYGVTLLFGLYTMGYSFILWRQFFNPLQSLWSWLMAYRVCCVCAKCSQCVGETCCVRALWGLAPRVRSASNMHRSVKCGDVFCRSTSFVHYALWLIAGGMTAMALYEEVIDAYSPLGICMVGGKEEGNMLKYYIVPFTIVFAVTSFFVPFAVYLLCNVAKLSPQENQQDFKQLGKRILCYFICTQLCWVFAWIVALMFYMNREEIFRLAYKRVWCMAFRGLDEFDECYDGAALWTGWYVLIALTLPLNGAAALMLSCNMFNRKRWKLMGAIVSDALCCKGYQSKLSIWERFQRDRLAIERSSASRRKRGLRQETSATSKSGASQSPKEMATINTLASVSSNSSGASSDVGGDVQMADL